MPASQYVRTPCRTAHRTVLAFAVSVGFNLDQASAGEPRVLKGHQSLISSVTFSPDSTRVASCEADDTVMIWNVATGTLVRTLKGHTDMVWAVAYSPDSKQIVSAGWDESLRIWDAETGEQVRAVSDKSGKLMGIAVAPDGKTFATVMRKGDVQIRDASTGQVVTTYEAQAAMFPSVAFSPDGKRLFATGDLSSYRTWQLEQDEDDRRPPIPADQNRFSGAMSVSPDGKLLATPTHAAAIAIHDVENSGVRCILSGHTGAIRSLAFSPDGKRLASAKRVPPKTRGLFGKSG